MTDNIRLDSRKYDINQKKEKPSEQLISELNQMITSIPGLNEEEKYYVVESIIQFMFQYDFDLYRSLSPEEVSILLELVSDNSTKIRSNISCISIDLFTFLIRNDNKLFDDFIELNLVKLLIANMMNTKYFKCHNSCIACLYELLQINNELRYEFISSGLPEFIFENCIPYPDKKFFEFLTLLATKPSFLPEISEKVIQSFLIQEVTQERTITVIKCLISFIRIDETLIIPIISSDFLEKLTSSLGRVTHTIAAFFKFSSIALQINQPNILDAFLNINIFEILKASLELVNKKEISFSDMFISSLKSDKSSRTTVVSANENLLRQSSNLMNVLLRFDDCLKYMEFVSDFDYAKIINEGLPFKTIEAIVLFLLNYSIKMPISIAKRVLNEEIIKNAFNIASSTDCSEQDNQYVIALSAILSKFANEEEIVKSIKNTNLEYDTVFI